MITQLQSPQQRLINHQSLLSASHHDQLDVIMDEIRKRMTDNNTVANENILATI